MTLPDATPRARLKHYGRRIVVREKYQRPEVKDLGTKWKLVYWDYSSKPRRNVLGFGASKLRGASGTRSVWLTNSWKK
jgi:hypothetical protein